MTDHEYSIWCLRTYHDLLSYSDIFDSKAEAIKKLREVICTSIFINTVLNNESDHELDIDHSYSILRIDKNIPEISGLFTKNVSNEKYLEMFKDLKKGAKMKKQSKKDKMDESLGMRKGKESSKKQSMKDRRDESEGMKKRKRIK